MTTAPEVILEFQPPDLTGSTFQVFESLYDEADSVYGLEMLAGGYNGLRREVAADMRRIDIHRGERKARQKSAAPRSRSWDWSR